MKHTYLHPTLGTLTQRGDSFHDDGKSLVDGCLGTIDSLAHYPPALFLLWVTPSFASVYRMLLTSIRAHLAERGCGDTPLLGSSVAVCLFDKQAHEHGAMLACMASRHLTAEVAVSTDAVEEPRQAVTDLLKKFCLSGSQPINPLQDRFMIAYVPGYNDSGNPLSLRAAELVQELDRQTLGHIPIYGGISSAGLTKQGISVQFANDNVHSRALAVALITTKLTYGVGQTVGLESIGERVQVERSSQGGRVIHSFAKNVPAVQRVQELQACHPDMALSVVDASATSTVLVPEKNGKAVYVQAPIAEKTTLEVVKPCPNRMKISVGKMRSKIIKRLVGKKNEQLAMLLNHCDVNRYTSRAELDFDLEEALRYTKEKFPQAVFVGCYLDGTIGCDETGRTTVEHWSVSEAFLFDDKRTQANVEHGYEALSPTLTALGQLPAGEVVTLQRALTLALRRVNIAGYDGGLISFVLQDGNKRVIVGREAWGGLWNKVILPETRRPEDGWDVLATVVRHGKAVYISDAQNDPRCETNTAKRGNVISFYAMPLKDESGVVFGVLQVDLGNRRKVKQLEPKEKELLDRMGERVTADLLRGMYTRERNFLRTLNQITVKLHRCRSVPKAVDQFLRDVQDKLGIESHLRLAKSGSRQLRLIGGSGTYYDLACNSQRCHIEEDDGSQSVTVFLRQEKNVVNDASQDNAQQRIVNRYRGTEMGDALARMKAFADFPIVGRHGEPFGMISFYADSPWYFGPSLLRSLEDTVTQLTQVLYTIARERQAWKRRRQLRFLRGITSSPEQETDTLRTTVDRDEPIHLFHAIQRQIQKVKKAANADIVSLFLWDKTKQRFVLRSQDGWFDDRWVAHAEYEKDEGVVGTLAILNKPTYLENWFDYERQCRELKKKNTGKYNHYMFDPHRREPSLPWEALALPLHWQGQSQGIVLIHRRRRKSDLKRTTGFPTTNPRILHDASRMQSSFFSALVLREKQEWDKKEARRIAQLGVFLHRLEPTKDFSDRVCGEVVKLYDARTCALYMYDGEHKVLRLDGMQCRLPSPFHPPITIAISEEPIWLAWSLQKNQMHLQRLDVHQRNQLAKETKGDFQQICLPVFEGGLPESGNVVGVLSLWWRGDPSFRHTGQLPHHSEKNLELLVSEIATVWHNHALRRREQEAVRFAQRATDSLRSVEGLLSVHKARKFVTPATQLIEEIERCPNLKEQRPILTQLDQKVRAFSDQLLLVQTIARELYDPKRARRPLNELVQGTLSKCAHRIDENQIRLDCHLEPLEANVDDFLLMEALKNVIDNAIEALLTTPPALRRLSILMHHDKKLATCNITIQDTGGGMKEKEVDQYLKGNGISRKPEGGGIGLFLTRLIVESHGGQLQFNTSRDTGTSAVFSLPLNME